MADAIVYVDGFNLYYGALKRTPYKWLDLGRLCTAMLPNDHIVAVKYYTARISARPGNPSAPNDQQMYLRALRTIPNLSITYGHFLTHSVPMALTGVTPTQRVWVDKTEEKGSDVNLASHLVRDACQQAFEVAALITNDSDLAEPVRIVRQEVGLPRRHPQPPSTPQRRTEEGGDVPEEDPAIRPDCKSVSRSAERREGPLPQTCLLVIGRVAACRKPSTVARHVCQKRRPFPLGGVRIAERVFG